jgi:hypothetical protein
MRCDCHVHIVGPIGRAARIMRGQPVRLCEFNPVGISSAGEPT